MDPIKVAVLLAVIVALSLVVAWAWTRLEERRAKLKAREAQLAHDELELARLVTETASIIEDLSTAIEARA